MTPSPPESPIDYNGDPDQRPPSCGDDIDFHRDSPAKLPKTNHVPFISNTHNVARVEPLPPPINSSSKYLSDDIDMLEELKARAKAALLKEAGDQGEDILDEISSKSSKKDKLDESLGALKSPVGNHTNKRPLDNGEEKEEEVVDITKPRNDDDFDDSENQPLSAIMKNSNDASRKQPPSKRLRRKSAATGEDDVVPLNENDISSSTKASKNPFDDEEDDEDDEDSNKARKVQKDIACEDEM